MAATILITEIGGKMKVDVLKSESTSSTEIGMATLMLKLFNKDYEQSKKDM